MQFPRLTKGPGGPAVRIALAQLALSTNGQPVSLPFTVNEGTEGEPKLVEREFLIAGFQYYGGAESAIGLLLPVTGEGVPEKPTKIIFYPTAPEGHVGHLEISEDGDAG